MLPRFSPNDVCLVIHTRFSYSWFKNRSAGDRLVFAFQRPSNYTKVFAATGHGPNSKLEWGFIADHDSCWRDGVKRTVRAFEEHLRDQIVEGTDKHPHDREISEFCGLDIISPGFCRCRVEKTGDYDYNIIVENEKKTWKPDSVKSLFEATEDGKLVQELTDHMDKNQNIEKWASLNQAIRTACLERSAGVEPQCADGPCPFFPDFNSSNCAAYPCRKTDNG